MGVAKYEWEADDPCCAGKPVPLYLIDEPSSFLDSEQRITASKVIKRCVSNPAVAAVSHPLTSVRFILHAKKTAFIIEHDFIMATYLADRVIVFEGQPAVHATATPYVLLIRIPFPFPQPECRPQSLLSGMNRFLASLEITFRRDPTNYRPRVNKLDSVKDREQKCEFLRGAT